MKMSKFQTNKEQTEQDSVVLVKICIFRTIRQECPGGPMDKASVS